MFGRSANLQRLLVRASLSAFRGGTFLFTVVKDQTSISQFRLSLGSLNVRSRPLYAQPAIQTLRFAPAALFHTRSPVFNAAAESEQELAVPNEPVTPKKFSDIEAIHPMTRKALDKVFQYKDMSIVQEAVLSRLPNEDDMFVKAKTGTGKTLAFLIAALETATRGKSFADLRGFDGASIFIVSPTRELALQIANEASKLTKYYPFKVHCFVGGESRRRQLQLLERGRCDIIVGTPGRLNDLLKSERHFKKLCQTTKVVVLDEADQLVDMGFKDEVQRLLRHLPKKRQTLLFSATLSDDVKRSIGDFALNKDYKLIDTVGEEDVNTHMHVKQSALIASYQDQVPLLRNLLRDYKAANSGKVIVFLPTTKATILYGQLFRFLLPEREIMDIHSGKSQEQRTRITKRFKNAHNGTILFTSDVSARGVDYPNVSLVVQVGIPSSRDQYIHRLGRTGRAGKDGEGILVLAPFEKPFIEKAIGDLPVHNLVPPKFDEEYRTETARLLDFAVKKVDPEFFRDVYTAFLGFCKSTIHLVNKRLVNAKFKRMCRFFKNGIAWQETIRYP